MEVRNLFENLKIIQEKLPIDYWNPKSASPHLYISWLLLTLESLQALARLDVPDLDSGVCVARDQDVVFELHAAGERLVPRQRVDAVPRLHVPDPYGRV